MRHPLPCPPRCLPTCLPADYLRSPPRCLPVYLRVTCAARRAAYLPACWLPALPAAPPDSGLPALPAALAAYLRATSGLPPLGWPPPAAGLHMRPRVAASRLGYVAPSAREGEPLATPGAQLLFLPALCVSVHAALLAQPAMHSALRPLPCAFSPYAPSPARSSHCMLGPPCMRRCGTALCPPALSPALCLLFSTLWPCSSPSTIHSPPVLGAQSLHA